MGKIHPFIWFGDQAEEAAKFYTSIFKNSKLGNINRYSDASANAAGRPKGSVMTVGFELEGLEFGALNGGKMEGFNLPGGISFVVNCDGQAEIDYYWEKLGEGGQTSQCGWLTDKFGVAWQIVPANLNELINTPAGMACMLKMQKLDIAKLQAANQP